MGILPGKDAHSRRLRVVSFLRFVFCPPACDTLSDHRLTFTTLRFCFGKALPSVCLARKPAPSGAKVEGLIQAARCRLRSLTALLAPTGSGLSWPGGLDSPIISSIQLRSSKYARSIRTHPDPGGGIYFFSNASRYCCQDILLIFSTPIFVASSPLQTTATKPLDSTAVSWVVSCLCM